MLAIRQHNKFYYNCLQKPINIVAVSGLGTSPSCVHIDEVARQMSMAYQNFLFSLPPFQNYCQQPSQDLLTIS
ncbi:hypothetical protein PN497_23985 [Sphaerospermopsis kisseleviana CS-549]|uniref:Uncharacterized protein n=1 Tax=Sphaerospermopsis kisseleviana CS-549 TaxID=3021783 RepID=A0ABT4ZY83_9CYAN|nr:MULTISPECIES: hypothetical protein [Sphaerospermopsis]MBD2134216.1 hypothetical protein [Sphaerospermopsis sp. FACHB-1094]MDB9444391.1 hypothetical protein [Sphaerospermopsis kisseleviana CS-549]